MPCYSSDTFLTRAIEVAANDVRRADRLLRWRVVRLERLIDLAQLRAGDLSVRDRAVSEERLAAADALAEEQR